jgi:rhodanese-related sulfurtransferase
LVTDGAERPAYIDPNTTIEMRGKTMFGLFNSKPKVSVAEVKTGLDQGTTVLIDVRDPGEIVQTGIAKGALNIPLSTLAMRANPSSPECVTELKSGKDIVLYCASGARSAGAAQMLEKMGHAKVQNLGSLRDWATDGGEISRR